jgi:hypothetical protein
MPSPSRASVGGWASRLRALVVGEYHRQMGQGRFRPFVSGLAGLVVMSLPAELGVAAAKPATALVSPLVGRPTTIFTVAFRSPIRTGVVGNVRLRELLVATSASPRAGCLGGVRAPVPDARRGERVRVRLAPAGLGGRWCPGVYRGRVLELQTAVCPDGSACPTYVRLLGTAARFRLTVRGSGSSPGTDRVAPTFAGLTRAFACTPGPQRPGETTPFTLSWPPATDNVTAASQIVYQIYYATAPGGEDYARPSWTTPPGATTFRTPRLPSHGDAYFVVRAQDAAGNQDGNAREQKGIDPCYT